MTSGTAERVIPIHSLDMTVARDTPEEAGIVIGALRYWKLHRDDLLYSGFDGQLLSKVLSTGVYPRNRDNEDLGLIFCSTEAELADPDLSAFTYLTSFERRGLAIYDQGFFVLPPYYQQGYRFQQGVNPRDALLTVVKLHYDRSKLW